MMKESIHIVNFGGLKNVLFELKRVNILIGPQASGKSVSAKLVYFFKNFPRDITLSIANGDTRRNLDAKQKEKFKRYFPIDSWPKSGFKIEYKINKSFIIVEKNGMKKLAFSYSDDFKGMFDETRKFFKAEQKRQLDVPNNVNNASWLITNDQFYKTLDSTVSPIASNLHFFIPAGRSFFANLQSNIYAFLSENKQIDPFLIEFGKLYENFKGVASRKDNEQQTKQDLQFTKLVSEILNGEYLREKDKDFIYHKDDRKVNLAHASSGQQEILPMLLILKAINEPRFSLDGVTLYIEEPEAHLFPTAQKKIVHLLASTFNSLGKNFQIIITTHSPYILSSFNNILEAGKIIEEQPNKAKDVKKVIPENEVINPKDLVAYAVSHGKVKVIMDKETQLISDNVIDSVSDEIAISFGKLLDIEF